MPEINVDVDLGEFEAEDLITELGNRQQRGRLDDRETTMLSELSQNAHLTKGRRIKSLSDRMKYETFMKNFDDITEQELEFIIESKRKQLKQA